MLRRRISPLMVRPMILLVLVLLVAALPLIVIQRVWADGAPPPQSAASDVAPGQGTQVQMISETVVLDIRSEPISGSDYTRTVALVNAEFLMRNRSSQAETMDVRFPMDWPTKEEGIPSLVIQGIQVKVDGRQTMTRQVDFSGQPWTTWPVTFAPSRDVRMQVTYRTVATEWHNACFNSLSLVDLGNVNSLADLYYILETGAGWRGPIGQGDIIFRFPYSASLEMIESSDFFRPAYTSTMPAFVVEGRDLHWHFTNLEPTSKDNVHLSVITPPVWQAILDARRNVQRRPQDAQAYLQMGMEYWLAVPVKYMWPEDMSVANHFGPLAEAAFKRAVELAPNDFLAHVRYARFLTCRAFSETPEPYYSRAVQEVNRVLAMDPNSADANELAGFLFEIGIDYLVTPTVSPIPGPMQTATVPIAKTTVTSPPMLTATEVKPPTIEATLNPIPTPSADTNGSYGLLLPIGFIVFLALVVVYLRLKR
jgi:hypothetical protein